MLFRTHPEHRHSVSQSSKRQEQGAKQKYGFIHIIQVRMMGIISLSLFQPRRKPGFRAGGDDRGRGTPPGRLFEEGRGAGRRAGGGGAVRMRFIKLDPEVPAVRLAQAATDTARANDDWPAAALFPVRWTITAVS